MAPDHCSPPRGCWVRDGARDHGEGQGPWGFLSGIHARLHSETTTCRKNAFGLARIHKPTLLTPSPSPIPMHMSMAMTVPYIASKAREGTGNGRAGKQLAPDSLGEVGQTCPRGISPMEGDQLTKPKLNHIQSTGLRP